MSCQKVVNVLAVASAAVSVAVVGTGAYVYVNKDAIIKSVTDGALESVLGGGLPGGDALPTGANDLPSLGATPSISGPSTPQASADVPSL